LLLIAALGAAFWPRAGVPPPAQAEDVVIATVNETPIYMFEYNQLNAEFRQKTGQQDLTAQDQKQIVYNLILRRLILQLPESAAIRSQPAFQERLKKTEEDLVVSQFFSSRLNSKVRVSDEELLSYYNKNKDQFSLSPKIEPRVILLRTPEEAQKIMEKIKAGEKFEDLAAAYSIDLPSAKKGGSLGVVEREKTPPDIWKELIKLKEGEVSGIVETNFGFNILKVEKILAPETTEPFESAKPKIRQILIEEKMEKAHDELRREITKDAKFSIFEERFIKPASK
jgi:parvulin-like peptidyl-prolyl isomerase